MKKFSIIIPIYNSEKSIKKCIDSVIEQQYEHTEIILINDGSIDSSQEICEKYEKDFENVILINQENKGVSESRNIGIKKATGDYIFFLDSDDYLLPNCLKDAMNLLEDNGVDILKCAYNKQLNKTKIKYNFTINTDMRIEKSDYDKKIYPFLLNTFDCSAVWGTFYRREIIERNTFDVELIVGEDTLFFYKALLNSKSILFTSKPYYAYVINESSVTHTVLKDKLLVKMKSIITVNQKIRQLLELEDYKFDYQNKIDNDIYAQLKVATALKYEEFVGLCNELKDEILTMTNNKEIRKILLGKKTIYLKVKIGYCFKNILKKILA